MAELFLRITVCMVFAVSTLGKVPAMRAFEVAVEGFRVVPRRLAGPAAIAVVAAELATVAALLVLPVAGMVLALTLLTVFSLAVASVLKRGIGTTCNCFGPSSRNLSVHDLARNGVTIAMCATWFFLYGGAAPPAPAMVLIAAMSAVAAFVLVNTRELIETLRL
ncbi:MauE/DoxX family redox-associated membrane protein [Nonomuraea typhae]|uniref:MauE/DoxX family redox-associated membrane protein n=1 Tax=Nonomuraea typhae TaxID=2603600 RepID=UPI0012F9A6BD|nr:MauE/DoxX family redox-associated membrane protein [Nonomuraea typhae]